MGFTHVEHTRDLLILILKLSLLLLVESVASTAAAGSSSDRTPRAPLPLVGSQVSPSQRASLTEAFQEAHLRLRISRTCASLFDGLDLAGRAALESSLYNFDGAESLKKACGVRVRAVTRVGGQMVHLCRSFYRLMREDKIVVLLHEALHTAGRNEAPADPSAPTSREITREVRAACSRRGR